MSIYQKRVSLGAYLKKGEDFKDGDVIEIASEGKEIEGQFGKQDVFMVKTNTKEGNVSFNQTTINSLIDAYGADSKYWIGKKAKVWGILSNVQGKMIKVYYFTHPEATIDDEGGFNFNKSEPKKPALSNYPDNSEIKVEDIPY